MGSSQNEWDPFFVLHSLMYSHMRECSHIHVVGVYIWDVCFYLQKINYITERSVR